MISFKSIISTRIETIIHTKYEVTVSTDLNVYNIIALNNELIEAEIFPCRIFKLYRRWTLVFSTAEFNKAIENGIIQ